MKKIILAVSVLTIAFAACKKDKTVSAFDHLTTGTWKVSETYLAKDTTVLIDYYVAQMQDCAKDNSYTFNADYSITSDEGATKCDTSVAQKTTDGTWALADNDKTFSIKNSKILPLSGDVNMSIVSLDDTYLKLTKDTTIVYPGFGSISGTVHVTFKKQ
jgi:hypothetical protein